MIASCVSSTMDWLLELEGDVCSRQESCAHRGIKSSYACLGQARLDLGDVTDSQRFTGSPVSEVSVTTLSLIFCISLDWCKAIVVFVALRSRSLPVIPGPLYNGPFWLPNRTKISNCIWSTVIVRQGCQGGVEPEISPSQ